MSIVRFTSFFAHLRQAHAHKQTRGKTHKEPNKYNYFYYYYQSKWPCRSVASFGCVWYPFYPPHRTVHTHTAHATISLNCCKCANNNNVWKAKSPQIHSTIFLIMTIRIVHICKIQFPTDSAKKTKEKKKLKSPNNKLAWAPLQVLSVRNDVIWAARCFYLNTIHRNSTARSFFRWIST